jgi:NAD(P)-dependent dehydrogenase (short-subunit alcohol dehydrogenase family)
MGWRNLVAGRFVDKTVIVTGASSGIGLEAARQFAAKGARVVLAARSIRSETQGLPS